MLIEWLKNEILTKATWHNDIPGICICQFEWIGPVNEAVNPFPTGQTSQLIEMFFCVEGEIIAQRGDTDQCRVTKGSVLVLGGTAEQTSFSIGENMRGVLVSIDTHQIEDNPFLFCDILGLDLKLFKSKMDEWPGRMVLVSNGWTQSLFEQLAFLPADEGRKYCLLKSLELLYVLNTRDYGVEYNSLIKEGGRMCQSVLDAQKYMEEHLSEKITITQLSRTLSVSPTYLKAEFRRMYGTSIHRRLIELRMRRAEDLIRSTDYPIYQIAQDVGYEGVSQFSAVFKRQYGVTPGRFKKMSKTIMRCPFR